MPSPPSFHEKKSVYKFRSTGHYLLTWTKYWKVDERIGWFKKCNKQKTMKKWLIKSLRICRAPWPCGPISHVLDREDGGSNPSDAFNLLDQRKTKPSKAEGEGIKIGPANLIRLIMPSYSCRIQIMARRRRNSKHQPHVAPSTKNWRNYI